MSRDGGVAARRAIVRWGWRLFRREWRQQLLILTLLTLAVTVAVGGASAAYSLGPVGHTARFGSANQMFLFDGADPDAVDGYVSAIEERFRTVDVIGRRHVMVPGSADVIQFRAQDPRGAYGGPMLDLLEGRYPIGADEVAVTDAVANTFDLVTGDRFTLDNRERTVVGLVENPADLRDEFALVPPAHADPPETVIVLVRSTEQISPEGAFAWEMAGEMPDEQQLLAAVAAVAAAAVAMVLVCLVAAAGFVVVAQRRQRQLGMLAAIGATSKQLRLVMVANGVAAGATAAVVGTALALVLWIIAGPYVETAAHARIDPFNLLPWWLIAIDMLLAVAAATAAAWWPARAVARMPVTRALSGRPPQPRPARRSAALAGGFIAVGVGCLVVPGRTNGALATAGTVTTVLGVLLISPLAVRALAAGTVRLPVAVRLALRDLARYRTRSSAALAAISLVLGIAATIVISTTNVERTADVGNLSASQLLITEEGSRIRELASVRTPAQVEAIRAQVNRVVAPLDDPAVIELKMAVDPDEQPRPGRRGNTSRHAVQVGDGPRTANPGPLFVATPQLLRLYGIDPDAVDPNTEVLTTRAGEIGLRFGIQEEVVSNVRRLDIPAHTAAPTSLITHDAVERRGWAPAFVGWFIDAGQPLTSAQINQAHRVAASAGLQIMVRDGVNLADLRTLRNGAMAVGTLVALAVLAIAVGLIRSEATRDLRMLTATGASSTIRRTLAAATAGALALLGGALAIVGAYLALATGFVREPSDLLPPPLQLALIAVGVPLAAAAAGWLVGGRLPTRLAPRAVIE